MLYNYIALVFFILFALFFPLSLIIVSKLLRPKISSNPVKNAPWESAEETIGSSRDIDNEYLPYFMLFLPFEIIVVVLLLWSTVARSIPYNTNLEIVSLGIVSAVLSIIGYKLAGGRGG